MFGKIATTAGIGLGGYAVQKLQEYKNREAATTSREARNPIFDGRTGSQIFQERADQMRENTSTFGGALQRKFEGMGETAKNVAQTTWNAANGGITKDDLKGTFSTTAQGLQTGADLWKLNNDPLRDEKAKSIFHAGMEGAAKQTAQNVWNAPQTLMSAGKTAYSFGKAASTTNAEDVSNFASAFGNKLEQDAMNIGGTAALVKGVSTGLKFVPHPAAKIAGTALDVLNTANTGANFARATKDFELPDVNTIEGAGLHNANKKLHDVVNRS